MTPYFCSKASFRAGQGFKFNQPYTYLGKSEGYQVEVNRGKKHSITFGFSTLDRGDLTFNRRENRMIYKYRNLLTFPRMLARF
jgi:hypothetical protein